MNRFQKSRVLFGACFDLIKQDRELILLPFISFVATMIVFASFALGAFSLGLFEENATYGPVEAVAGFFGYLTLYFISIFFNASLILGVDQRMKGEDPTLSSAMGLAWQKRRSIFAWALFSATLATAMRMIEERFGIVGQIIVSIFSIAWSLVAFLVLPILVLEDIGVRDAIKKSTSLFKQTWGERMMTGFQFVLVFLVAILGIVALALVGIVIGGPIAALFIAGAIIGFFAILLFSQAITATFQTVLYHYAANQTLPDGFDEESIRAAFIPKKRRGLFG